METPESISQYLIELAKDLQSGKSIQSVLDDLRDALEDWEEEFPEV